MRTFEPYSCISDEAFIEEVNWAIADTLINGISSPGHSPGSCMYYIDDNILFSGDSVLQEYDIITRFKTSDKILFEENTKPYIRSLSPELIILPGHGNPFKLKEIKTKTYNV